jgi:hypothetical protein
MRRTLFSICFFLTALSAFSQTAKHVVLISIDGFRPDFYLDKSWHAPHLRKLMESGVYASNVRSVVPSVTYPAHTTIVTGALPARHGVYYNAPKDATNGQSNNILANVSASEKNLFRVVSRRELDALGVNPEPVLALAFSKGVVFNDAVEGAVVRRVKNGGSHGYFPDFPEIMTGFIAAGAGINRSVTIREMGIQDIAPLIARLLKIDFQCPDGKLHQEILKK